MVLSVLFCISNFFQISMSILINRLCLGNIFVDQSVSHSWSPVSVRFSLRGLFFCGSYWPSKPKQSGGAERTSWWFTFNKSKVVWLKFHSTSDLQRQPVRLKLWMPHHCVSSWGGKRQRKWKPWHCVSSRWWEIWAWVNCFVHLTFFVFWWAFSSKGGTRFSSSNFLMRFDGRFHPRVAPRLTFCSSNFFMCFDGRFHPRVAPHLSKCQMGHKWSTNKVTVISNGGPNWSLIRKFNLVSPAQHWNPVVHSLATCGLCYLWQGVL